MVYRLFRGKLQAIVMVHASDHAPLKPYRQPLGQHSLTVFPVVFQIACHRSAMQDEAVYRTHHTLQVVYRMAQVLWTGLGPASKAASSVSSWQMRNRLQRFVCCGAWSLACPLLCGWSGSHGFSRNFQTASLIKALPRQPMLAMRECSQSAAARSRRQAKAGAC